MNCPYCGNNPIPHAMAKGQEALSALTDPFDKLGQRLGLRRLIEPLALKALPHIVSMLAKIGIIRFNADDVNKAQTTRSKVIWQEAKQRGIPMEQLVIFGKHTDFYRATIGGKTIFFESLPIPAHRQTPSQEWLDDKLILKEKLLEAGLPASRGGAGKSFADIKHIFKMLRKPVIIKPALGSRGRHTTTHIYTEDQLKEAVRAAKQIAEKLVIEEHLFGSVYRATIVDGKLVGVLRGDPPRIVGDGVHTIRELIEIKNKTKHEQVKEVELTDYSVKFLARSGYTPESIPEKGKVIDLLEKIGIGYGGYKAEEITITHAKTKQILEEVGRAVGAPVMGFDFIIPDITRDPDEQNWGVIECNSLPFIDLHHFPLEGEPVNVAAHVWNLWASR